MIDEANIHSYGDSKQWPPVTVEVPDSANRFKLALYFAHAGKDAPFLGFQVTAERGDEDGLDPKSFARLTRNLPKYVAYAQAFTAWTDDWPGMVEALRLEAGKTRRGLPDTFYREIAAEYAELVAAGDPHPFKTIADRRPVHKSRASRWVKEAQERGYLEAGTGRRSREEEGEA